MLNKFNDLTIGQKLNIGFGILVLLLLLMVSLIFAAGRDATHSINLTVDVRVPAALASTRAQSNLLKMRAAVRGYLAVGDLKNIDDYNRSKTLFQENLAQLRLLAVDWSNPEDVERLDQLTAIFAAWLPLPEQVFALHDNPLRNQPALQLSTEKIQPLSVQLLADIEQLITIQSERPSSPGNRTLLATMIDLQSSQQAMTTNLRAYAGTGDLVYKFGYAEQMVSNGQHFGELDRAQAGLTGQQWLYYSQFIHRRERFLRMPDRLFAAVEGPQSHRDLYLFQNEMEPQAEKMLQLLDALTTGQQMRLQQELNNGAQRLAGVQYQTLLGGMLALLLGVAMAYLFRESIAGPIRRLNTAAQQFGRGRLDVQATVEYGDEIGRLAITFNTMVSRLRRVINELAHARDMAETANRAKSNFLARMSHELRTPLNGILGYAQILARNPALDESQRHALGVINDNGEHLLTLITDILDFSKIEARKLELTPTQFALCDFLNGIFDVFQLRAVANPAVQFSFSPAAELPTHISADEQRLRQILVNLLDNAFKFTKRGEINFLVESVGHSPGTSEMRILRFVVDDSGIGMSAAELTTIFLPFEQAGDQQQRSQGTGLGLAISHELAHAMGGSLTASSVKGKGSRFVLELSTPNQRAVIEECQVQGVRSSPALLGEKKPVSGEVPLPIASVPSTTFPLPPSPQELTVLLDLARKGELPRLRRRVTELAQVEPRYQPFAHIVIELIEQYDEEQLMSLLEQCASHNTAGLP